MAVTQKAISIPEPTNDVDSLWSSVKFLKEAVEGIQGISGNRPYTLKEDFDGLDAKYTQAIVAEIIKAGWIFTIAPVISSTAPRVRLEETDAATDEKLWELVSVGGDLRIRTRTDADGTGVRALSLIRGTGTAISEINLAIATVLEAVATFEALATFENGIHLAQSGPTRIMVETTNGGTDEKLWDLRSNASAQFNFRTRNDADSSGNTIFNVNRTGTTVDNIVFLPTVTCSSYIQTATYTDSQLDDEAHAVNTDAGKVQGAMVYNSTQDIPVWAVGATDNDIWVDGSGATINTPAP